MSSDRLIEAGKQDLKSAQSIGRPPLRLASAPSTARPREHRQIIGEAASRTCQAAAALGSQPLSLKLAEDVPSAAEELLWQQVLTRDPAASFVYAVRTTGIFCRSTCPSRRPLRANVRFFPDAHAAALDHYRPCARCQPERQPDDAALVQRLAAYLAEEHERRVPLAELAQLAGKTPATVQRLFTRILGLSPRAWANARRTERYRALLAGTSPRITDAVYAAGFSSPSRAHGAAELGMQARSFRNQGYGESIGYAVAEAAFSAQASAAAPAGLGSLLVAATARGICAVLLGDQQPALIAELTRRFPRARLAPDPGLAPRLAAVLSHLGEHPSAHALPLDLRGTAFQARVWAALGAVPRGSTTTYSQLAASIGAPKAIRAVANACGQNPAAILVPCHRVIGADGALTGYRWGLDRKRALLALEQGRSTKP